MNQHEAFLRAIIEAPDEDTPRVVYADWLDDHDQPERAEFIRVQCMLARLGPGDGQRTVLEEREKHLLAEHGAAWAGPLGLSAGPAEFQKGFMEQSSGSPQGMIWPRLEPYRFRRGFVDQITIGPASFVDRAETFFRVAPITSVRLRREGGERMGLREFLASPHLDRLHELDLGGGEFFPPLWGGMWHIVPNISEEDIAHLAAARAPARLKVLKLDRNNLSPLAVMALANSPLFGQLTSLDLQGNEIGPAGVQALFGSSFFHLKELNLSGIQEYNINNEDVSTHANIGEMGARLLAESSNAAQLTSLDLAWNQLTPLAVQSLCSSAFLGNLTHLRIYEETDGCAQMGRGLSLDQESVKALQAHFGDRLSLSAR